MTLAEWFTDNRDKEVEFKDGVLTIKEEWRSRAWEPLRDSQYYFIDSTNTVLDATWDNFHIDRDRKESGNLFMTREEAKEAVKRLRFRRKLEESGAVFKYRKLTDCPLVDYEFVDENLGKKFMANFWFRDMECLEHAERTLGRANIIDYVVGRDLDGWHIEEK